MKGARISVNRKRFLHSIFGITQANFASTVKWRDVDLPVSKVRRCLNICERNMSSSPMIVLTNTFIKDYN